MSAETISPRIARLIAAARLSAAYGRGEDPLLASHPGSSVGERITAVNTEFRDALEGVADVAVDDVDLDEEKLLLTRKTFTVRAFVRSHGRLPSRTALGTWVFQLSTSEAAHDSSLIGEPWFAPGYLTLAQAKRAAVEHFADWDLPFVAVLP